MSDYKPKVKLPSYEDLVAVFAEISDKYPEPLDFEEVSNDNSKVLEFSVPGVDINAIDVSVRKGTLTVIVKPSGKFFAVKKALDYYMEHYMDPTQITAFIEKGILTVRIPYKSEWNAPVRIDIKTEEDEC